MKKLICVLLAVVLLLMAGCGAKEEATPTEATVPPTEKPTEPPTEAPTEPPVTEPPAPETVSGIAKVDKTEILLLTMNRGDTVELAGEFDENYYIVKLEEGFGLIEKRLVRLDGEPAYESWDGFAKSDAALYGDYLLIKEPAEELSMNDEITVLDTLGDCLVVQFGDIIGYMLEDEISTSYIRPYSGGGGGNSSGGGGGGGADGGDITLSYYGDVMPLAVFAPQEGELSGTGTVLANDAQIILGWFDRDDTVDIISEEGYIAPLEGWYPVYVEGLCGYVQQYLILQDGEESYAEWDGYARRGSELYDNYYLRGEPVDDLSANEEVRILCDLGNCYLVSVGEQTGYMIKDQVSDTYITYSSGGSSSSSGSSGGSSGGDWTPPVL